MNENSPSSRTTLSNLDPGCLFPDLRLGIYRFTFQVHGKNRLSKNLGSAWRGLLGDILQKLLCPWGNKRNCQNCTINTNCVFYLFYDQTCNIPGHKTPPRPFVVRPLPSGKDTLVVEIVLVNLDDTQIMPVLMAFQQMRELGTEKRKAKLSLLSIEQRQIDQSLKMIWSKDNGLQSDFRTTSWKLYNYLENFQIAPKVPWNIETCTSIILKKGGTRVRQLDWSWTFKRLANRLSRLSQLNGAEKIPEDEWSALNKFFSGVGVVNESCSWHDWHRDSSRQKRKIPMGGLKGIALVVPPEGTEELWLRWWMTAAFFHLGKKTSMGQGMIKISEANTD